MNILASCKQRLAERRAERLAKARSDEIDRQLQEECLANREQPKQHDILLLGSCFPSFLIQVIVRADWGSILTRVSQDHKQKHSLLSTL